MVKDFLGGYFSGKLSTNEVSQLVKSFDIVGDIAIVKIPQELKKREKFIAKGIMTKNKNVRTVLKQVTPVSGDFRLRTLKWVAGEKKTETNYREYGCTFIVDLSEVYFSPRLSFERFRIANLVKENEIVLNMFSGVGCFSIIIAKHVKPCKVVSIDINSRAIELQQKNISLNHLKGIVETVIGDAEAIITKSFRDFCNRVLMPLPEKSYEYLDAACMALKSGTGFIHYYDFVYAKKEEDAIKKSIEKVGKKFQILRRDFEIVFSRVVRTVGPNWNQIVLDINL